MNAEDEEKIRGEFGSIFESRSRAARTLYQLIRGEKTKADSPFSKWQLKTLSNKLDYGVKNSSLVHYACVLNEISHRNLGEGNRPEGMGDEAKIFFVAVEDFIAQEQQRQQEQILISGGIFMEYDAVINQMLLWCHDWEIPQDNPLYAALAEAAQAEVDRRVQYLAERASQGY